MIDGITDAFEEVCKRPVCAGYLWIPVEVEGRSRAKCLVCGRSFPMRPKMRPENEDTAQ